MLPQLQKYLYKEEENEYLMFCPFCEQNRDRDKAPHLYFSKYSNAWSCQKCWRFGKTLESLVNAYGIELSHIDKLNLKLEKFNRSNFATVIDSVAGDAKKARELDEFINESGPIAIKSSGYNYLVKRGISIGDIESDWCSWDRFPQYVFWRYKNTGGKITFFSGRNYLGLGGAKYHHVGGAKPLILFNENKIILTPNNNYGVFLVEGLFDALFAPGPAIPMWGKILTKGMNVNLCKILYQKGMSPLIALDSNEPDANIKLADEMIRCGFSEIYLFRLSPYHDFGENGYKFGKVNLNEKILLYTGHNKKIIKMRLEADLKCPK